MAVSARAKTQLSLTVAAALAAVDLFYDLDGALKFVRCVMRFQRTSARKLQQNVRLRRLCNRAARRPIDSLPAVTSPAVTPVSCL